MKIELKLNFDTIMAVSQTINKVYEMPVPLDERAKVYLSISYDLADKFGQKVRGQLKKQTLFDHKRLHKITLKFHEAWALKAILINFLVTVDQSYQNNLLQQVINILDQKTA